MPGYKITAKALRDMAEIVTYLHREVGPSIATTAENQLYGSFEALASTPALGHRRQDLTARKILFHTSYPYVIFLRRIGSTTQILRVVHGARDLRKFL